MQNSTTKPKTSKNAECSFLNLRGLWHSDNLCFNNVNLGYYFKLCTTFNILLSTGKKKFLYSGVPKFADFSIDN